MKFSWIVFIVFGFVSVHLSAQRYQDWVALGDQAFLDKDPLAALHYYKIAFDMDSSKAEIQYKYAEALRLNHYYQKSAHYYYKVYRKEQGSIYPYGGFWLALMQKQSGKYYEAKQTFRRVRDQFKNDPSSYYYIKAVQEMRSCDFALLWAEESNQGELNKIGGTVNSSSSEFDGKFQNNGNLQFTSLRGDYDEIGKVESEDYSPRVYLSNSDFTDFQKEELSIEGIISIDINPDSTARVSVIIEEGINHVMVQKSDATKFTLPFNENDTAWYSHAVFGMMDQKEVLFFSSNRYGGFGMEDIWYVFLDDPENLINAGPEINTPGSEITPFYRYDLNTLFFSSDWHYGFGGYDIFSSECGFNSFGIATNLKSPFNTRYNDLYYRFNNNLSKGTLTSNRLSAGEDDGMGCCNDLWMFIEEKAPSDKPLIANLEDLNKYLPVTLYFHNDEPNPRTRNTETEQTYLETYQKYLDLIPVYESEYRKGLSENKGVLAEEEIDKFFIQNVDQGVADLELFTSLLLSELQKGSRVELTVRGFASPLAETDYNVNLTSRRISSLINYLDTYQGGVFKPYFDGSSRDGGLIKIIQIPFGEYTANEFVSDNPNESNAIYGISAALERKIEIVSVQQLAKESQNVVLEFDSQIIDFGKVEKNQKLSHAFNFQKSSNCVIDSVYSEFDNLKLELVQQESMGLIKVDFNSADLKGKQSHTLSVKGNFAEGIKKLYLTFEVIE